MIFQLEPAKFDSDHLKTWIPVVLAFSSAIAFGVSNVMYKIGLNNLRGLSASRLSLRTLIGLLLSHAFVGGILLTFVGGVLYILAIYRGEVSVVVATLSISYIVTALLAWRILGEELTALRLLGLIMIIAGVFAVNFP